CGADGFDQFVEAGRRAVERGAAVVFPTLAVFRQRRWTSIFDVDGSSVPPPETMLTEGRWSGTRAGAGDWRWLLGDRRSIRLLRGFAGSLRETARPLRSLVALAEPSRHAV